MRGMLRALLLLLILLLLLSGRNDVVGQVFFTTPYFNLAQGKEILATATCGTDYLGPETYCKILDTVGLKCDYCDPNDDEKQHPPEYAVDGFDTDWQSPPISRGKQFEEVNLTVNLGQEFQVAYVFLVVGDAPRPGRWILDKSNDHGKTWTVWQYFAESLDDCDKYFGKRDNPYAICTTPDDQIVAKLYNQYIRYFDYSDPWFTATNVRLRFLEIQKNPKHEEMLKDLNSTIAKTYFYTIIDMIIGGRCICNGHASNCSPESSRKHVCQKCQDNTCGPNCETCCQGFEQKKWRASTNVTQFTCEPCNCFNHSDECIYDPEVDKNHLSLDIHGNYEGGGVCQNCKHNTEGINCDRCKPGFYRQLDKPLNATDVCQPELKVL